MRVLIASHNAAHIGGVETYVDLIVPALIAAGHEAAVWHEEGAGAEAGGLEGVPRWFHRSDPRSLAQLAAWRPSLVFSQGLRSPELERQIVGFAPAVAFAHSYVGTCVSGNKMHAFPAAAACTRRFGAACLGLYYPRRCGGWNPITAVSMYGRQAARLRVLERYRRILVASHHMAAEYARHGFAARTSIVSLPAPADDHAARIARTGAWRLLYLGRLEWTKGPDIAIDAAARAAAALDTALHLVVAGHGSLEPQLRARAASHAATDPRVSYEFTGMVAPDARAAILRRSDLLLIPSRWPEPFGLVGNEAGIARVPALAFSTGGIPDWLTDGVDGRLVPAPPDVEPFARGLAALLADPAAIAAMGEASHARALRYSLARHVRELDDIFTTAVEAARA